MVKNDGVKVNVVGNRCGTCVTTSVVHSARCMKQYFSPVAVRKSESQNIKMERALKNSRLLMFDVKAVVYKVWFYRLFVSLIHFILYFSIN